MTEEKPYVPSKEEVDKAEGYLTNIKYDEGNTEEEDDMVRDENYKIEFMRESSEDREKTLKSRKIAEERGLTVNLNRTERTFRGLGSGFVGEVNGHRLLLRESGYGSGGEKVFVGFFDGNKISEVLAKGMAGDLRSCAAGRSEGLGVPTKEMQIFLMEDRLSVLKEELERFRQDLVVMGELNYSDENKRYIEEKIKKTKEKINSLEKELNGFKKSDAEDLGQFWKEEQG